ncbi:MAG: DUF4926 domain-containing protein [Pseudanabaena sp. CAN_BIN31]|jgi:hypothetical protein|nr:DUF4926 domain-containing protein [Pseudanabaena sp. CAN_BIN31]
MRFPLYSDVILLTNLAEEGVYAGDIGTVVEQHNVTGLETGYSVEFFDMLGNTATVITLPISCFRLPTRADRPAIRLMASAA